MYRISNKLKIMNRIFILLISILCLQCANDKKSANQKEPQRQEAKSVAVAEKPKKETIKVIEPEIGSVPATKKEMNESGGFTLVPTNAEGASGGVACVDITTKNFNKIISMQYTMQWDPKVAKFEGMKDLNLPSLGKNNFGMHILDQGLMTFVWIDNTLSGITLSDGSPLYTACFKLQGKSGDETTFQITNKPTRKEALDASEKLVPLSSTTSTIKIK
jgi:hypothetical protein